MHFTEKRCRDWTIALEIYVLPQAIPFFLNESKNMHFTEKRGGDLTIAFHRQNGVEIQLRR